MERYNYLRPTPEEVAALHNEDDESSDEEAMDFSDAEEELPVETEVKGSDDSIQIFEISSSNFSEPENSNKNNKENTEARKKKVVAKFYATRQTDRKMRSGNVGAQRSSRRMQRKITKSIKKVVKAKMLTEISVKKEPEAGNSLGIQAKKNRNLRSAEKVEIVTQKTLISTEKTVIVRSLRSNTSQSNVMKKPIGHVRKLTGRLK